MSIVVEFGKLAHKPPNLFVRRVEYVGPVGVIFDATFVVDLRVRVAADVRPFINDQYVEGIAGSDFSCYSRTEESGSDNNYWIFRNRNSRFSPASSAGELVYTLSQTPSQLDRRSI